MKIAYCGYDFFSACLVELLACKHNVYRVFTYPCDNRFNFNQYIKDICKEHNIPLSEQRIDQDTLKELAAEKCNLIITAGYKYKIPDLANVPISGINIHPTLLPIGRGVWPLPWTILTDQQQSGVTIHKLTNEYDTGDVLLQQSFPLMPDERLESLSAKVQLLAKDTLRDVIADFENYWKGAYAQSGETSQWSYPSREQRTLNWQKNVDELDRVCRAFGKFGCFATFDKQKWVVYGLHAWKHPHNYPIGSVVHKTNTEMIVAARDGLVSLLYFDAEPN
ncbi:methionyl-tRNA formyltransferase [Kaarinaea lacus]